MVGGGVAVALCGKKTAVFSERSTPDGETGIGEPEEDEAKDGL